MSRRFIAAVIVGTGFVCGAWAWTPTQAQEKDESAGKKVDQVLQTYESRAGHELEQIRKEISRQRKELSDLLEMRYDLALSQAELRAEQKAATAGTSTDSGGTHSTLSDHERQRQREIELTHELRQVHEMLRSAIMQTRSEAEQAVTQLRMLRAQERQRQEQLKAERERIKEAESKDKSKEGEGRNGGVKPVTD